MHVTRWPAASIAVIALMLGFGGIAKAGERIASNDRDHFYWLGEINKASLVMLVEREIVSRPFAAKIAQSVTQVLADGEKPGAARPTDYLQVEPLLIAVGGPDVTRLHAGRSRHDIVAATRRFMMRDRLIETFESANIAREKILEMAERWQDMIIPAYTNGIQAQPLTYGHYLLGYAEALDRDGERLRQAYARLNMSPLGAVVLGTTSFPIDRPRLAELAGFDGMLENSFGAVQLATQDAGAEMVGIADSMALTVGTMLQDIQAQYHQTKPWALLSEGKLIGPSSSLPQKRNPYGLNNLRQKASEVLGTGQMFLFEAHNVAAGIPDYKLDPPQRTLDAAREMFARLKLVLDNLVINPERAQAEVDEEYSTTTELADTLQRDADVPFRVGHHVASDLVTYGRRNNLKWSEIPFEEVQRIYAKALADFKMEATAFPLSKERFYRALSARGMIEASKGLGGPQPAEVKRMLEAAKIRLAADRTWVASTRERLKTASVRLDEQFTALYNPR